MSGKALAEAYIEQKRGQAPDAGTGDPEGFFEDFDGRLDDLFIFEGSGAGVLIAQEQRPDEVLHVEMDAEGNFEGEVLSASEVRGQLRPRHRLNNPTDTDQSPQFD